MSSFRGKLSLQILPITSFLVNAKIRKCMGPYCEHEV